MRVRARHLRLLSQVFFVVLFVGLFVGPRLFRGAGEGGVGPAGPRSPDRRRNRPGRLVGCRLDMAGNRGPRRHRGARPVLLRLGLPAGGTPAPGVVGCGSEPAETDQDQPLPAVVLRSSTSCCWWSSSGPSWVPTTPVGSTRWPCSTGRWRAGCSRCWREAPPRGVGSPSACWRRSSCCRRGCPGFSAARSARRGR